MRQKEMDPACTLDIPPGAFRTKWYRKSYLLLGALAIVLIVFLLIPKKEYIPILPAPAIIQVPKIEKKVSAMVEKKISVKEVVEKKVSPEKVEKNGIELISDNIAVQVYLKPLQGKVGIGLKLSIFKKKLSIKKDWDYMGFLRKLAQD